jgi:Xaa-Pro aminopeptidase
VVPSEDLPTIDHGARVRRLVDGLGEIDALLLTDLVDVRWLTGFTGSNGWVVVRPDGVTLGTDGRYGDRARAESAGSGAVVIAETNRARLDDRMHEALAGAEAVGLDDSTTTHRAWVALAAEHPIRAIPSPVGRARQVKDEAEVARIARAAAATDAALEQVEPMLFEDGVTEADIRNELEHRMRLHGADDRSYATIVAAGPEHAARPHHEVSDRRLAEGDTVVIDVGALVDGYHSDMTRSWVIGEPDDQQREWYELVALAQTAGLAALSPGASAREVDEASRSVFRAAGLDEWYLHGTGHGVGLLIHEPPFHGPTSADTIQEGNVVTIEPGLYRGGFGGFRIEDLVVVRDSGPEVLTHSPKRSLAA